MPKRFHLGQTAATRAAHLFLSAEEVLSLLSRHAGSDWGDLDDEDKEANERAISVGARILSKYTVRGEDFYVITEADRSVTTILFCEEY